MGDEKSFSNLHELDKFSLLLFSHLKLSGVDVVDVVEVARIITQYGSNLYNFELREMINGSYMLDIDSLLMSAYLQGHLDCNTRKILLNDEYIKEIVIPSFSKEVNDFFKYIVDRYNDKMKTIDRMSTRNFVGDLFVNHNLKGRRKKEKN